MVCLIIQVLRYSILNIYLEQNNGSRISDLMVGRTEIHSWKLVFLSSLVRFIHTL